MAFLLAYQADQDTRCPGCDGPLDETTDPERQGTYDAEVIACHRCAEGDRALGAFRAQENADTNGLRVRTFERPEEPDEEAAET